MATILFADGQIKFASGGIIFVPTGADPDDCDCCGSQCPVCVDYSYGESEVTISGFPASVTFDRLTPIFNQRSQVDYDGLDKVNGVYTVATDEDCIWQGTSKTVKFTITTRIYNKFTCDGGLGTLLSTTTVERNAIVDIGPALLKVALGLPNGLGTCKDIILSIADSCVGGTDSEFFACNGCPSIAGFTASATWVPTLV